MEQINEKVNYCLNCPVKPCANKGCPLGNDIPAFIKAGISFPNGHPLFAHGFTGQFKQKLTFSSICSIPFSP